MWAMSALLFVLFGQGNNDGELLFRRMEEKLADAKTMALVFEGTMEVTEGGNENVILRRAGSLSLSEGNKMRLEVNEGTKPETMWRIMISDGTRLKVLDKGSDPQVQNSPKSLSSEVLAWVTRAGILLPQMPLPDVEVADGENRYAVSNFRLGSKETVNERETQQLQYQLVVKGHPGTFSATIWLDTKTDLPVKRLLTFRMPGQMMTLTENYTTVTLDGKVDAKDFELSKQ